MSVNNQSPQTGRRLLEDGSVVNVAEAYDQVDNAWRVKEIAGGGGGGGGAVTIADGADVTQGAIADAKVVGDNAGTLSAKLRGINYLWNLVIDTVNSRLKVDGSGVTQPVSDAGSSLSVDDGGTSLSTDSADGAHTSIGATTDAEAAGDGSLIAVAKRIRSRLDAVIAALAGTLTVSISGTPTVNVSEPVTVDGTVATTVADGANVALGSTADDDSDNTVIGWLAKIVTALAGTIVVSITGTPTVNQGTSPWIVGDGASSLSVDDGGIALSTDSTDGAHATLGATTDAEAAGDGTIVAILKRIRTLLGGVLNVRPASPAAGDYLPVRLTDGSSFYTASGSGGTSVVSSNNSTSATLTSGSTFTGTGESMLAYKSILLTIHASHASASGGVKVQWSSDNSNWDREEVFDYPAADLDFAETITVKGEFMRVTYTNGGTGQTTFRLETILHPVPSFTEPRVEMGRIVINGINYPVKRQAINCTASGDTTVISSVSGRKLAILFLMHTGDKDIAIIYKSGSNTLINAMSFAKNGGPGVNGQPAGWIMETNAGEAFVMNLSTAANVRGMVLYAEIH